MSLKPLIIDLIVLKHIHISISIIRANNDIVGIVFHTMNRCTYHNSIIFCEKITTLL